jgi:hypothetical protein
MPRQKQGALAPAARRASELRNRAARRFSPPTLSAPIVPRDHRSQELVFVPGDLVATGENRSIFVVRAVGEAAGRRRGVLGQRRRCTGHAG